MSKATLTADMIDALSTCHTLDSAAQSLILRETEEWADWVQYFLISLQQSYEGNHYEDFLQAMQRNISTRLQKGHW